MGAVADDEVGDEAGEVDGELPGDGAAPVVGDHDGLLVAQRRDQLRQVPHQLLHRVPARA